MIAVLRTSEHPFSDSHLLGMQEVNKAAETMRDTCQSLDEQTSLRGTIQKLRRCQAADESRMEELLKHIADLGVGTQELPSSRSWRIQAHLDTEAAESPGALCHLVSCCYAERVAPCLGQLQLSLAKYLSMSYSLGTPSHAMRSLRMHRIRWHHFEQP